MNKKLSYVVVFLFLIPHNYINPSTPKELLKNVALFYAGSGLGLWAVAYTIASLSDAVPVYVERHGKNVFSPGIDYWKTKNPTESSIKKVLISLANLFLKTSQFVGSPVKVGVGLSVLIPLDFVYLIEGLVHDTEDIFSGNTKERSSFVSRLIQTNDYYVRLNKGGILFSPVIGFGVPLILQGLYQKLQK